MMLKTILLFTTLVALSACGTVQLESRTAPEGVGNVGTVYVQGAANDIPEQSFETALKTSLADRGYTITAQRLRADYIMRYKIEDIVTRVGGSYVLPDHQTTTGYVGQDRVSLATRQNKVHDWAVDVPETIVRANFRRGQEILWEGGMLIRQEAFNKQPATLADRFMSAFGKDVNATEPLR